MNSNLFSVAERKVGATRQAGGYGPGIAIDTPVAPSTDAH